MIIDNANFHHGGRIQDLIEAGCNVVYLPPYFLSLNRIEKLGLAIAIAGTGQLMWDGF